MRKMTFLSLVAGVFTIATGPGFGADLTINPSDDGSLYTCDGCNTVNNGGYVTAAGYIQGIVTFPTAGLSKPVAQAFLTVNPYGSPNGDPNVNVYAFASTTGTIAASDANAGKFVGTIDLNEIIPGTPDSSLDITKFLVTANSPYVAFNLRTTNGTNVLSSIENNYGHPSQLQVTFAPEPGGLYEIVSGTYTECCGLLGEARRDLPYEAQRFVRVALDGNLASMALLGQDMKTVFSVFSCSLGAEIDFHFDHGLVLPDRLVFQVDPGPGGLFWNYDLKLSGPALQLDGMVGTGQGNCADAPTEYTHKGVQAIWVSPPKIRVSEVAAEGTLLFIEGHADWTVVVQASNDLADWEIISTSAMPNTLCPICPFIQVRDKESTSHNARFYRCSQRP